MTFVITLVCQVHECDVQRVIIVIIKFKFIFAVTLPVKPLKSMLFLVTIGVVMVINCSLVCFTRVLLYSDH